MKRARFLVALALVCFFSAAQAHIGSPNVFFEGYAGPYPVRVVIRPPGVIPGLADISVRVNTNNVQRVLVLPIHWSAGKKGAPRPDEATPVSGETNLFTAQLWFMRAGAESVEIEVNGAAGHGRVIVPVNAIATRVLEMPRGMGVVLAVLAAALVLLAVSIFGGAVRESVLAAGESPTRKRVWLARGMMALTLVVFVGIVKFGGRWWDSEAGEYRNKRLFRPITTDAELVDGKLRVRFGVDLLRRNGPLVPDHGKLMHLFLVREPGMDVFAHLHPTKIDWQTFEVPLPKIPAGDYTVYGDVTYETGLADTLSARINIPAQQSSAAVDRDDAWRETEPLNSLATSDSIIGTNLVMVSLTAATLVENSETTLRFAVRDREGRAIALEPYMGMGAHLILRRDDGTVFTHLHPSGTFSMAAKQLFDLRTEGKAQLKVASYTNEPICKLPIVGSAQEAGRSEVSFPYAFPKAGKYRLWVQTRVAGDVVTGVFDVNVEPARRS